MFHVLFFFCLFVQTSSKVKNMHDCHLVLSYSTPLMLNLEVFILYDYLDQERMNSFKKAPIKNLIKMLSF